jgi:CRISPR-associated protein Cmr2
MGFVLVWSCGPVQDFIATARKGRDLWFGSWLLSEIAATAALAVVDREGTVDTLVMPAPADRDELRQSDFSASNKLLVRASGDAAELAGFMSDAARKRLVEISQIAFEAVDPAARLDLAGAQIEDLLEIYWAAADEEVVGGYAAARRLAEVLHAARKTERPFRQPSWAAPIPKSSLDGARESVIPEKIYDELSRNPERLRVQFGAGPAERLSGVDLLKRFGHRAAGAASKGARIQSTSHIASWSTRRRLDPALHKAAFDEYIQTLKEDLGARLSRHPGRPDPVTGPWDGHVLYTSRLGDFVPADRLTEAEQALETLFRRWRSHSEAADRQAPPAPTPYYAVLVADGDRLGQLLDRLTDPTGHRAATRALQDFARRAAEIVEDARHGGQAVYTGGDDVLALLPARSALDCARDLAEAFSSLSIGGSSATLSAGICIGHHLDPLHRILDAARTAEKFAKQSIGRDAWAITLNKRSGSPVTLGGRWRSDDDRNHLATCDELQALIDLYDVDSDAPGDAEGGLPRGLAYDLRAADARLRGGEKEAGPATDDLSKLRALEGQRLLIQKGLRRVDIAPPPGSPAAILTEQMRGGDLRALAGRLEIARALTAFDGGGA